MRNRTRPEGWVCPFGCQPEQVVEVSDAMVFGDAALTIIVSVLTMIYVILRHPLMVLTVLLITGTASMLATVL